MICRTFSIQRPPASMPVLYVSQLERHPGHATLPPLFVERPVYPYALGSTSGEHLFARTQFIKIKLAGRSARARASHSFLVNWSINLSRGILVQSAHHFVGRQDLLIYGRIKTS